MSKLSSDQHMEAMRKKYWVKPLDDDCEKVFYITGYNPHGTGAEIAKAIKINDPSYHKISSYQEEDLDLRNESDIREFGEELRQDIAEDRKPVALINCAAVMDLRWFEEYNHYQLAHILGVNLIGAYELSAEFVRATLPCHWPKYIVHIGSMAAKVPLNGSAPYCISKAGLDMMCRCMAFELAPKGYNVLCVHPSSMAGSPMEQKTIEKIKEFRSISMKEAKDYWETGMIRDRMLAMDEMARLVTFFVTGQCDFMSGASIPLTGGNR